MSGNYSGYYKPTTPVQPFRSSNRPYRQPFHHQDIPYDYNPGFPPRSPTPPKRFPEYSLWGDTYNLDPVQRSNMITQAPQRPPYPSRRGNEGSRPFYRQNIEDHLRTSPLIQRDDRLAWHPFISQGEEQLPMTFQNDFSPQRLDCTRTPMQYIEVQPQVQMLQRNQPCRPQLRHNVPQWEEPRSMSFKNDFSPQRSDKYCRSPFQPNMQFSEDPQLNPRLLSSPQRSNGYTRSPFPASEMQYNSSMNNADDTVQLPMPIQTNLSKPQLTTQRPDGYIRSPFSASEMQYNSLMDNADDPVRPLMPVLKPSKPQLTSRDEHTRSPFPASELQCNSNSMDYVKEPSHPRLISESEIQCTQLSDDKPQVMIPRKKRNPRPQSAPELKLTDLQKPRESQSHPEEIEKDGNPELTSTEEKATEVTVIERKALYQHSDNFQFDMESDVPSPDPQDKISNSSGSSGEWTSNIFKREGDSSTACNNPFFRVKRKVRKTNLLERSMIKALSQPVQMEKGARMMQRMGWIGGGLGKEGTGIVDPIAPNAIYATTTAGFGQEVQEILRRPTKREQRSSCAKRNTNKKFTHGTFKTNVLLCLLQFATNDMQSEICFEAVLKSTERKRIHRVVDALKEDSEFVVTFPHQKKIVDDIRRRCRFTLTTQSDGAGEERKLCVFKEAPEHMYLVTPDDCRPCLTDVIMVEEEPNPFLKSITKHIKDDPESAPPATPNLIDVLAEFFVEFCEGEKYTEFRFLGPFNKKEMDVINCFFTLIEDLSRRNKPDYVVPIELLDAFDLDYRYYTELDPNGFASIKKIHCAMEEEFEKLPSEENAKRLTLNNPLNHIPSHFASTDGDNTI